MANHAGQTVIEDFTDLMRHVREQVLRQEQRQWKSEASMADFLERSLKEAMFELSQLPIAHKPYGYGGVRVSTSARFRVADAETISQLANYSCEDGKSLEEALDLSIELILSAKSISDRLVKPLDRPSWQTVLALLLNSRDHLEVIRLFTDDGVLNTELAMAALGIFT